MTHTDAGATRFNFSEFIGNSIAVAVSNAYYPQTRTARDNLEKVSMELGIDSISNVAKEFWPDIKRKLPQESSPCQLAERLLKASL